MLECRDIDGLMMDWLYQELARDQRGEFDAHVESCDRCAGELAMFQRTREAVSVLPEVEPPSSITAILMHEAARAAPARPVGAVAVDDDEPGGILGWLSRLFSPIVLHPAATAIATLVLVAGVAGSIYIRGDHQVTTHEVASEVTPPAAPPLGEGMMRMPDEPAAAAPAGQAGYAADLVTGEQGQTWNLDSSAEPRGGAENEAQQAERLSRGDDLARPQKRPRRGPPATANAISGTDLLVDLDDGVITSGKAREQAPAKPKPAAKSPARDTATANRLPAQDPPPPPSIRAEPGADQGRYRVYKDEEESTDKAADEKADENAAWAAGQKRQLDEAARLEKCQAAARIANDILDRNPDFYYQKVDRSASVKSCSGFVTAERQRRVKSRGEKRAAKKQPPRKGASSSSKAKAAPADESVEADK